MTVEELIDELNQLPLDLEVVTCINKYGTVAEITGVERGWSDGGDGFTSLDNILEVEDEEEDNFDPVTHVLLEHRDR